MYPDAYIAYLAHFHGDRDYFECHEILEEYWKSLPRAQRSALWVGLIQIAVALYHQRRGNFPGASKMMESAARIIAQEQRSLTALGIDAALLLQQASEKLEDLRQQKPYESIQLPLIDNELIKQCRKWCEEHGMVYGQAGNLADPELIHRHTLRDRSGVIREREESLRAKQESLRQAGEQH